MRAFLVCVCLFATALVAFNYQESKGRQLIGSDLDKVLALGCGQIGAIGPNCTGAGGVCATKPSTGRYGGVVCVSKGSPCGSCTGRANGICTGPIKNDGRLCYEWSEDCCPVSRNCIATFVAGSGADDCSCSYFFGNGGGMLGGKTWVDFWQAAGCNKVLKTVDVEDPL
jgi:hypothetical protein